MSFSVTLRPSGVEFPVGDNETVLSAATAAGIGLPYSCAKGVCRTCRGYVLEGELRHQYATLSPEDFAKGHALLCQAIPLSDLVLEAKVVPLPAKSETAKALVAAVRDVAPDVKILTLRLPPRNALEYQGGQYIDILLPDGVRRSYSVATAPVGKGSWEFDLHVRHTPGGRFTDHIFGAMKPREVWTICGPRGTFFLREGSDKPIILIATGTGYAPLRALLLQALANGCARDIRLYWGGRTAADLYMTEEALRLAAEHENFTFTPVLSRSAPEDGWDGPTGYVTAAVVRDFPDMSNVQVYACGLPAMIDDARDMFTRLGLPEDEFFADAFLDQSDYAKSAAAE